jgi:type I restriction enzyme S subunit
MTMRDDSWPELRIKDLGEVFTGRTPSTEHPAYFGDDYPFITPSDMHQGKYARATQRSVSHEGAELLKRVRLPANSVCVSCIGWQMGEAIMTDKPSFTNQQINAIVPNSKVDPSFLYYSLLPRKQELLSLGATIGARTPILKKSAFCDLKVRIPTLPVQRRIAGILSAHDDLIDNNNRRISILDEMAHQIYREWFIEFRFPGHEKAKFSEYHGGELPSGWERMRVGDAFEVLGGATPSTKEPAYWDAGTIPWFSPSDLTRSRRMFLSEGEKKITLSGLENCSARLFPPYSVMMTSRATLGVLAINRDHACTNQGFITCIPNDRITCPHLYLWLAASAAELEMLGTGATFKEITKRAFKEYGVVLAPPDIERLFFERTWPLLQMIETLEAQNENLRLTRDLLLPKLLSGELDGSTIDAEQLTLIA